MSQQQIQGTIKTRNAVLVFCKGMVAPMVLYFDNCQKVYAELKALIGSNETKLVEFEPLGPIKKAVIDSSQLIGVAIQEEQYLTQE